MAVKVCHSDLFIGGYLGLVMNKVAPILHLFSAAKKLSYAVHPAKIFTFCTRSHFSIFFFVSEMLYLWAKMAKITFWGAAEYAFPVSPPFR